MADPAARASGWWDSLFGTPQRHARQPQSRGALLGMGGYQQMPDMKAGIEDQRQQIPESTSLSPEAAINTEILSRYPRGSHVYNADAYAWLQQHMPDDLPTTPIAGSPPTEAWMANRDAYSQPAVIPTGPRSGPQFLDTLRESVFGSSTPQPAHPASRGALLGAAYQGMPSAANVEDRRAQGIDYTVGMNKPRTINEVGAEYWPSDIKGVSAYGRQFHGFDPLVASPLIAAGRGVTDSPVETGGYAPSFPQNLRPPRKPSFPSNYDIPAPSYGPSGLPYIPPHLPISPGDPGWAPPSAGMTLNSVPQGWQ